MGSHVYAGRCRAHGEKIDAMMSLETIGYYSEEPGSQHYPVEFHPGYPDRAEFSRVRFESPLGRALAARPQSISREYDAAFGRRCGAC